MRRSSTLKWLFAACALAFATGPAGAQSRGAAAPGMGAADQVLFRSAAELTQAQQQARAGSYIAQMEQTKNVTAKKHLQAISNGDVVLANCLKDKLTQMEKSLGAAKERQGELNGSDGDRRAHAFTMIVVQRDNVQRLSAEASQCLGKELNTYGISTVVTTLDPSIPPDPDKYNTPVLDPPIMVVPPPCASCIR